MKTIPREPARRVGLRRDYTPGPTQPNVLKAYLFGALHDGTYSKLHRTWRISQSNQLWLMRLKDIFQELGFRSWIYKEGKKRSVSVIETTAAFLRQKPNLKSSSEKKAYIRGFFDAEGGIPRKRNYFMYIQFSQKNKEKLQVLTKFLTQLGIKCGKIHNPSYKVDAEYWRFYICKRSHQDFIRIIGSWHPRKQMILAERNKI